MSKPILLLASGLSLVALADVPVNSPDAKPPLKYAVRPMDLLHARESRTLTGMPSIAVSRRNGRLWATGYAAPKGGENYLNYTVLLTSADGGRTWKDVLYADPDGEGMVRAFDPEVFIAADGKLVWSWTDRTCDPNNPEEGCFAPPTTDKLRFVRLDAEEEPSAPYPEAQFAAWGVMMCKPIVLKDGRTLLPLAHWYQAPSACFYSTRDWKTFEYVGGVTLPEESRQFDEHSVVELDDGTLKVWIRTSHEPVESVSKDGGRTWSEPKLSQVGNPNSRLYCGKLPNGHLLMVKHGKMHEHFEQKGWLPRRELRAFVSKDDGATWQGDLLVDGRARCTYPDGDVAADGSVYICHDRGRYGPNEIVFGRITEADVLAGALVSKDSFLTNTATIQPKSRAVRGYVPYMAALPLGAVKPDGWLRDRLESAKASVSRPLSAADGEHARALVALSLALDDPALKGRASEWVDGVLESQCDDGDFGTKVGGWTDKVKVVQALSDWYGATDGPRVKAFLHRYFNHLYQYLAERPPKAGSAGEIAACGDVLDLVNRFMRRAGEYVPLYNLEEMLCDRADGEPEDPVDFRRALKIPVLKTRIFRGKEKANDGSAYRKMISSRKGVGGVAEATEWVSSAQSVLEQLGGRVAADDIERLVVSGCLNSSNDVASAYAWAKVVQTMWFDGGNSAGGLLVWLYGPSVMTSRRATIRMTGDYPFGSHARMDFLKADGSKPWPLYLRRPAGCGRVEVRLNGEVQPSSGDHTTINRVWKAGDSIEIVFGENKNK